MAAVLKIVDERFGPGGTERRDAVELRLVSERVTPREIIRRRVEAEIEALRLRKIASAHTRSFLIEAAPAERALNRLTLKPPRVPKAEDETARACAAFERQGFIMLFDERQIDDLDACVTVTADSKVVFLYLTPLKGG